MADLARSDTIGVLLMAYGTPDTPDEVEPYFTHIRGGRTPSPEAVQNLKERYAIVGGKTPLLEITHEVARLLEERLLMEANFKVYAGMKHWHPFIGDVMERMTEDGVSNVVAFALAPHCSLISLGGYRRSVEEAQRRFALGVGEPFNIPFIKCWHHNEKWRDMWANLVREGLRQFPEEARGDVTVLFSAHSLPERIRTWDDPYERQLLESSADVARRADVSRWRFAFQSEGHTGEPWLGPDIVNYLETLHDAGVRDVLSVPLGFVSDHLEILYDIDYEAKQKAEELDMNLFRTQMPNTRPDFIEALASVVRENLWEPHACWCYPDLKGEPVNFGVKYEPAHRPELASLRSEGQEPARRT